MVAGWLLQGLLQAHIVRQAVWGRLGRLPPQLLAIQAAMDAAHDKAHDVLRECACMHADQGRCQVVNDALLY